MVKRTAALLLVFFLLLGAGCSNGNERGTTAPPDTETDAGTEPLTTETHEPASPPVSVTDRELFAMDTQMTLRLYGDDDGAAAEELIAELTRLDGVLSPTDTGSALYALNRFKFGGDADILSLTQTARALNERTGGALDITLLPLSKLWGFYDGNFSIPSAEAVEAEMLMTGMDSIRFTEDGSVRLSNEIQLDFGALAKGYAADLCAKLLAQRNVSAVLTLGGNVQTVGGKPDGSEWKIGVRDPADGGENAFVLSLAGTRSVVTSGDYERCFFDEDGTRYCHILDPKTGCPVQNTLRSVTIVADSGVLADGLSTALFVMGLDGAKEFCRSSGDFDAAFIENDGTVWITPGLEGAISCETGFRVIR